MKKKKGICESIAEQVINKIKAGELRSGDRLPNEKEMADEYGVSRISLREALRYLAARGLIVTRHGDGTFINTYRPEWLAEAIYEFSLLDVTPLIETLELRKIMEAEAARLCCINATKEEIAEMRRHMEAREEICRLPLAQQDADRRYASDLDFHMAIAKGTHNRMFSRFIEIMHRTIEHHKREVSYSAANIKKTTNFHRNIMQAIEQRNGEEAAEMMRKHINMIDDSFKKPRSLK